MKHPCLKELPIHVRVRQERCGTKWSQRAGCALGLAGVCTASWSVVHAFRDRETQSERWSGLSLTTVGVQELAILLKLNKELRSVWTKWVTLLRLSVCFLNTHPYKMCLCHSSYCHCITFKLWRETLYFYFVQEFFLAQMKWMKRAMLEVFLNWLWITTPFLTSSGSFDLFWCKIITPILQGCLKPSHSVRKVIAKVSRNY